ncbi:hypothetical protein P4118_21460 [Pseudomonas aeruginosa]|nr:hypothetical protein [Pseudomonas aeruginosa]
MLESVPSLIQGMLAEEGARPSSGLRWMLLTGERCRPELARQWLKRYPRIGLDPNAYAAGGILRRRGVSSASTWPPPKGTYLPTSGPPTTTACTCSAPAPATPSNWCRWGASDGRAVRGAGDRS